MYVSIEKWKKKKIAIFLVKNRGNYFEARFLKDQREITRIFIDSLLAKSYCSDF